MNTLSAINFALAVAFSICCCYQMVYAAIRLFRRRRTFQAQKLCKYAVLIAARNEETVIGQLLDSIREQDYPSDLIHIYVVADNCTDGTAQVAADHGAFVFQRRNRELVGKGYAISFLLSKIREDRPEERYDGYFVFDADNLLDPRYVTEMNKVFSCGNRVVTGYRNSKNFGDNWITAGYGLYFLRESEYLNRPRDYLGVSCAVSGTGFLFADSLLQEIGGWNYHLLTEDLEFTADMIARGERISYCGDAMLYDEQPRSLRQSVCQRSRWIKGSLQVLAKRGGDLLHALVAKKSFACYDMLMNSIAVLVLAVLGLLVNIGTFIAGVVGDRPELGIFAASVASVVANAYGVVFFMGLLVAITEWKKIRCPAWKKVLYAFTFPFFMLTFTAAMAAALFGSGQWKPIRHTAALSIGDLGGGRRK